MSTNSSVASNAPDVLVVGAGVVGLTSALALARRGATVRILESEPAVGLHASGRNSGVLHAGFYYGEQTLKAALCRDGCARMTAWCVERGLPILRCGKLVVAQNEAERLHLHELARRGRANGVAVTLVDADEARRIEPRVKTHGEALHSPSTASVDPARVMSSLVDACAEAGVSIRFNSPVRTLDPGVATLAKGQQRAGHIVNTAGLYADRLAHSVGVGQRYRIVPFRGFYLEADHDAAPLGVHIYPVPSADVPFLGVHLTVRVDGSLSIGPTATPALWRRQYGGVAGFDMGELAELLGRWPGLFAGDPVVRRVAMREVPKLCKHTLVQQAQSLVSGIDPARWRRWGRTGIRSQLYDIEERRLHMDFCMLPGPSSTHVLNAVSPGFTSSFALAERVADAVQG